MAAGAFVRRASPDDVGAAASLILESGALRGVFRDRSVAARIARRTFLSGGSAFGHRRAIVAERDGLVVGYMARFPSSAWPVIRLRTGLTMLAGAGPWHATALITGGRRLERGTAVLPHDTLYVISLAVASGCRGGGIGARLLAMAVEDGRRLGLRAVALDTRPDNVAAIRFYRREGFEVVPGPPLRARAEVLAVRLERAL